MPARRSWLIFSTRLIPLAVKGNQNVQRIGKEKKLKVKKGNYEDWRSAWSKRHTCGGMEVCRREGGGLFKQVVLLYLGQWENALEMRMCTGANFQGEEETADEVPKRVVFVLSSDGSLSYN